MTIASPTASFGLPEALRGIYAAAGGPSRLARIVGLPLATQIALTGKPITAAQALSYHIINAVSASQDSLIDEAIALAGQIAELSPDAVIVTRASLREAVETASVERATELVRERYMEKLMQGENAREGLMAFAEKRKPNWVPSKL
jgi:enoyl-CoA hydratase/carnithine racemase